MPSEAEDELGLERDPGRVLQVMELRSYAQAYYAIHNAKKQEDIPKGAMADLVADIEIELLKGGIG